jgi:hypothetical protein
MFFSSRILSGISLLAGSCLFWIVQDGCDKYSQETLPGTVNPLICTSVTRGYGNSCDSVEDNCDAEGTVDDFDEICTERCVQNNQFYRYTGCSSCTSDSVVFGTECVSFSLDNSKTDFFNCTSLSNTNSSGTAAFTCKQKICGSAFNYTIDCISQSTGVSSPSAR